MVIFKNKSRFAMGIALTSVLLSTTVVSGLDYKAIVITPETIIREEKAINSKELDKLNLGAQITVKEILDNWYRVELPNGQSEGWIFSEEAVINDNLYKESSFKKGEVTTDVLNVRMGPSTNDARVTQIRRGNIVTIINTSNEWYEVVLSNNMKGWVHSDYIKTTYNFPKGNINTNNIVLREQANDIAGHVANVKKDEVIYIKDYVDNWYNVITSNDKEGWIESKYVTVLSTENVNVNRSGSSREVFSNIDVITEKYLGKKYVSGGNGPNGFDCSGFTSYILKTYYNEYLKSKGINQFPRTASGQATIGTPVSRANLEKGDLVFFDTAGKVGDNISHVGIYIGNGQIIHAATSRGQIAKDFLSDRYYSTRFMKAIRL